MFAVQLESKFIMIEVIPKLIHTVMTFKTIFPKRNLMIHHKHHIHSDMTFTTGRLIKMCDVIPMTILTQERFILSC